MNRKKIINNITRHNKFIIGICLAVIVVIIIVAMAGSKETEDITYRETTVEKGELVVGITESGSVDIGTVDQVFELDMSALQRAQTGSSSGNSNSGFGAGASGMGSMGGGQGSFSTPGGSSQGMGGMSGMSGGSQNSGSSQSGGGLSGGSTDMFGQIFNMAGSSGSNQMQTSGNLTISEVCVSIGQKVQEGDILYLLEEESVEALKEELQSNVEKAEADLKAVYADQELSRRTAQYNYDSSIAYGDYASLEYDNTIKNLQNAVKQAREDLAEARALHSDYSAQLSQFTVDYEAAVEVLNQCIWTVENTDKWTDTYAYATAFQLMESARSNVDTLKQKKEQLESNTEQALKNVNSAATALNKAERNLESGMLTADKTLALRKLAYSTAQETYDIALAYLEDAAESQEATSARAKERWEEFDSHIDGNAVRAVYNGVITSVPLAEGDTITTNDTLVTLYDTDSVDMTVSIDEDDMTDIAVGTQANINLTAYPNKIFQATVSEISDASRDSNGNVTYEVTVIISGDTSGLFQGMTGDVTLITRQTKEVVYVSNRAIIREGKNSYVKVKKEDGSVSKQKVTTGFSDGVNVEIIEGLSCGDTVLIESKVSKS
ncbi:MAG: efflux RND transporter periplasmic adaptor subunit [Lachnospiraceae bacterium]|nr:efflux RND transporter periplasmic adaptor subunit [Lachnospiraceae bacterium]